MSLIVEDGTAVANANSYVSLDDAVTYATARGLTLTPSPSSLSEQAIIRATAALDAMYRMSFPGYKTNGRSQSLEWPRTDAYDYDGQAILANTVPIEVVNATCEIAVRELATPGSMMPDLDRGGNIRSLRAGSVAIEYGANASAQTTYTIIDGILSAIIGSTQASFVGTAVRG